MSPSHACIYFNKSTLKLPFLKMCMLPLWKVNFSGFKNIPLLSSEHRITCADPGCKDFILLTCRFFETVGSDILAGNNPLDLAPEGCSPPLPPRGILDWPRQLAYFSGGSKGAPLASPTHSSKFSQFHAGFRKFWQNHVAPPPGFDALSYGESWIRPCIYLSIFR